MIVVFIGLRLFRHVERGSASFSGELGTALFDVDRRRPRTRGLTRGLQGAAPDANAPSNKGYNYIGESGAHASP